MIIRSDCAEFSVGKGVGYYAMKDVRYCSHRAVHSTALIRSYKENMLVSNRFIGYNISYVNYRNKITLSRRYL